MGRNWKKRSKRARRTAYIKRAKTATNAKRKKK